MRNEWAMVGDGRQRRKLVAGLVTVLVFGAACSSEDVDSDDADTVGAVATDATAGDSEPDGSDTVSSEPSSDDPAPADPVEPVDVSSVVVDAMVSGVATSALAARVDVETDQPTAVQIIATAGDHEVRTPITAAVAESHSLPLVGLRADRTYEVRVIAVDDADEPTGETIASFTSGPLPNFLPDLEITSTPDAMSPGLTLVEPDPVGGDVQGHLVALDQDGEVVWYHRSDETITGVRLDDSGNFVGVRFFDSFVEFDVFGDEVGRWQLPAEADAPPDGGDAVERLDAEVEAVRLDIPWPVSLDGQDERVHTPHHEFLRLPDGNFLALARVSEFVSPPDQARLCPDSENEWDVASDLVIEFEPDGTVVRTWNLSDALDLLEFPGVHLCETETLFSTPTERDWTHANAVEFDAERDLVLVSVRHTDQVVAFERGDTVGHQSDVAWILGVGGNVPIDGDPFFHPHAPEVQSDGSILIYDNGNFRPGDDQYSRAVQYSLSDDGGQLSAVQTWEHRVDDIDGEPLLALFLGDTDRLANGNVLVAHGGIGVPGSTDVRARVIEVIPDGDAGGEIVFDLRFGSAEDGITTYRAERIESLYVGPLWRS